MEIEYRPRSRMTYPRIFPSLLILTLSTVPRPLNRSIAMSAPGEAGADAVFRNVAIHATATTSARTAGAISHHFRAAARRSDAETGAACDPLFGVVAHGADP